MEEFPLGKTGYMILKCKLQIQFSVKNSLTIGILYALIRHVKSIANNKNNFKLSFGYVLFEEKYARLYNFYLNYFNRF